MRRPSAGSGARSPAGLRRGGVGEGTAASPRPSAGAAGLGALPGRRAGCAAPPGLPWGPGRDAPLGFILSFAGREHLKLRGARCSAAPGARATHGGAASQLACFPLFPSQAAARSPSPCPGGSVFSASGPNGSNSVLKDARGRGRPEPPRGEGKGSPRDGATGAEPVTPLERKRRRRSKAKDRKIAGVLRRRGGGRGPGPRLLLP